MHTACWDPNFDWENKKVALIGAGSSGIQVLPTIQPLSQHVYHYMRGKTWISPVGYAAEVGGGKNRGLSILEFNRNMRSDRYQSIPGLKEKNSRTIPRSIWSIGIWSRVS